MTDNRSFKTRAAPAPHQLKVFLFRLTTMLRWYAPFPLPPSLEQRLREAGLEAGTPDEPTIDLWIYDSPDRLLGLWRQHGPAIPSLEQLLKGYASLAKRPAAGRLISSWRLEQLDPRALGGWLLGRDPAVCALVVAAPQQPPAIQALEGQLVLRLLEKAPNLLDAYLDLELQAELAGHPADSSYIERLHNACTAEALLASWWEQHTSNHRIEQLTSERDALAAERDALSCLLQDAKEEAELTLLQLHQVQKELEQVFLQAKTQEEQLATQAETLQQTQKDRDEQAAKVQSSKVDLARVKDERDALSCQLQDAKEEAELTLLQLHQVQEELEHYFLVSRDQANLLSRQNQLTQNAIKLASGQLT